MTTKHRLSLLCRKYPVTNLLPGQVHVTAAPKLLFAAFGSCVAVCLDSGEYHVGGMGHCMLPFSPNQEQSLTSCRYVNNAVAEMVRIMTQEHHVPLYAIKAKLFGGARLIRTSLAEAGAGDIGSRNVTAARSVLKERGLVIEVEQTGGETGYNLFFFTQTGEAFVKLVPMGKLPV